MELKYKKLIDSKEIASYSALFSQLKYDFVILKEFIQKCLTPYQVIFKENLCVINAHKSL